jgi:retron-type reverse transcriptase
MIISGLKEIRHGVPQGSVLSPILFLLDIKDHPVNIQGAETAPFADDTNILIKAANEYILHQKQTELWKCHQFGFMQMD